MTSKARTMVSVSSLLSDMVQSYHEEFLNVRAAVNWLMGLDDPVPSSRSSCPSLIERTWPCHSVQARLSYSCLTGKAPCPPNRN
jgi:hypothetical protein